jgi:adenosylhomocysteinase
MVLTVTELIPGIKDYLKKLQQEFTYERMKEGTLQCLHKRNDSLLNRNLIINTVVKESAVDAVRRATDVMLAAKE